MTETVCEKGLPIEAARGGDPAAWEVLFRRFRLPLYVYIQEMIRNEQLSLDLVQETFLSATRYLDQLRVDARFGSWLFGIAHQKCLQIFRKRNGDPNQVPFDAEMDGDDTSADANPLELLSRSEEASAMLEALDGLTDRFKEPVLLHWIEGFSLEEIADILAVPVGTVKSRIHKAKQLLRTKLKATL